MILASLLGTTWKGINMIGMMNECTQARRPKPEPAQDIG
jgi:hypothetical protein